MFSIPFHCFFRTFISQIHPKGSTPHILLFSKSWSQISVLLIKIGKTKFPDHHLMAHAPPRVAKGFGLLIHAMSYLHASDLQPTATDSSAGHLHSINRKLLYPNPLRRRDTPSRSCRRSGSPIHAPLDLLTRTTRRFLLLCHMSKNEWCHVSSMVSWWYVSLPISFLIRFGSNSPYPFLVDPDPKPGPFFCIVG